MKVFIGSVAIFFLAVLSFVIGVSAIDYWVDNIPTKCWVEGKLVFDGRSACVNVKTSGASTTVVVKTGFLCMFPAEYYVSNDVKLVGSKKTTSVSLSAEAGK